MNNTNPRFNDMCSTPDDTGGAMGGNRMFVCDYISGVEGAPGTRVTGNTFNWSAYLRDSWQIQPNLTLNAACATRAAVRYADFLQNTVDPLTQTTLGKNAMTMDTCSRLASDSSTTGRRKAARRSTRTGAVLRVDPDADQRSLVRRRGQLPAGLRLPRSAA